MKNRFVIRFTALIAVAVLFAYCKKPTEFKEIEVNDLYSLQMPVYLHPAKDLLPFTASNIHQYEDSVGKICLLVFDTSRKGFEISTLKVFYDSMTANPAMDSFRITSPQLIKVNNDSTYVSEITGILNKERIFGEIETIATPDHYFYLQTWAGLSRREELKSDMLKILSSFKANSH